MVIKYKNWAMTPASTGRFDLERLEECKERLKGVVTGAIKSKNTNYGFDISFEYCLQLIIFQELADKQEVVTIEQFVEAFREEFKKIKEVLK